MHIVCPIFSGYQNHVQIPGCDNAYLKYQIVAGEDWQPLDGLEDGITQASRASQGEADYLKAHTGMSIHSKHFTRRLRPDSRVEFPSRYHLQVNKRVWLASVSRFSLWTGLIWARRHQGLWLHASSNMQREV